jgi:predicted nucleic acid-binding protein
VTNFLDTNILIHAFTRGPLQQQARTLLIEGGTIGVQTLNEFALTARRRLGLSWQQLDAAILFIRQRCDGPVPLSLDIHLEGLRLAQRYELQIYDALLLAAALSAGCTSFLSEDMHDGLHIDNRLTIRNPFG